MLKRELNYRSGRGGRRKRVRAQRVQGRGGKSRRRDGCLNHNLLDGVAGGQGGFCSKYLLPVDLALKVVIPIWSDYRMFRKERCQEDICCFFLSSKKSTPDVITHLSF